MKAPDKIYVSIGPRQSLIARAGKTLNSDTEYIRKEALLEWAREKAKDYKGTANIRRSFEMMIRKIESV